MRWGLWGTTHVSNSKLGFKPMGYHRFDQIQISLKIGKQISKNIRIEPNAKLLGTVNGRGYDCRDGEVNGIEGHDDGIWNKVCKYCNNTNPPFKMFRFYCPLLSCPVISSLTL